MDVIDSETRHEGVNYKAIGAHGRNEDEFLYFAQPSDAQLKAHREHDESLNTLLDREFEEDDEALYREASLEPVDSYE